MSLSIKFKNITFAYPGQQPIFSHLNLELAPDKTFLLKGDNGIGKTTLAALAAGLLHPQSGRIYYFDENKDAITGKSIYHQLSFLQQNTEHNLLGVNPIEDLKLWLLSSEGKVYDTDVRIERVLQEWKLSEKKTTPLWELSSGELKSLAMAGLSLRKNRYWILDEPLASLDENHIKKLLEMLKIKQKVNPGMLIISHQTELFKDLVDEVLTLTPQGLVRS